MSRIVSLEVSDVLRIKTARIEPNGSLVIIGGNNGQGKTSALRCVESALAGKDAMPGKPVREGAERGCVVLELDDMTVTRTFSPSGETKLTVSNKEGTANFKTPQTLLDSLYSNLSFDPLAFSTAKPAQQLDMLKRMIKGVDFDTLEGAIQRAYTARTEIGREGKRLEGISKAKPIDKDAPENEVDLNALLEEQTKIQNKIKEIEAAQRAVEEKRKEGERLQGDTLAEKKTAKQEAEEAIVTVDREHDETLARLRKAIEDENEAFELRKAKAAKKLEEAQAAIVATQSAALKALDESKKMEGRIPDMPSVDDVQERIRQAGETNKRVAANKDAIKAKQDLDAKVEEYNKATTTLETARAAKREAIASAKFPIEGLSISDDGVLFNGIPLDQCSDAEKLRVSVAIGLAENPKLKVLLVRNGSLLDDSNLALIAQMAEEAGAQVWVERVGKDRNATVIFEDGVAYPNIKVQQDGNAWVCTGPTFTDLQNSDDYAFGDTQEEAVANYYAKPKNQEA